MYSLPSFFWSDREFSYLEIHRECLEVNREKIPVVCLPFPVMNGPSLAGCFSWSPSLEIFAGVTGLFKRFNDFEIQLKLLVIVIVHSKMYSTNKMS